MYLDRTETLSLRDTYVPLAGYRGNETERVSAAEVLRDSNHQRIIILGDPGSGKSTLLRAFGASLVQGARFKAGGDLVLPARYTPVFVSLRNFARYLESKGATVELPLMSYIDKEILARAAGVRQSGVLLDKLLASDRLLLLLDGLDEVPDKMMQGVRAEVLRFVAGRQIRVVLTCRRQNFLVIRTDWVPVLTDQTYTLAPLKDEEIRAFISRRERDFRAPRTPSDLFQSIVQSGTLELHRVPLILTVSIGLYIHLTGYKIPTSLTAFYSEMIKQLLTRHDFRLEVSGAVNVFSADDKQRFLREFAHVAATRSGRFEDFSLAELVAAAEKLTDRLPSVRRGQGEAFINEIINRSGLLVQASMEADYIFAHRSIQEYLIASRLLGDPQSGSEFLLAKAEDREWRLVTVFFSSFEHDYVESFLAKLRLKNLELCGHCLAVASVADRSLAAETIEALQCQVTTARVHVAGSDERSTAFSALVMLSNSSQSWVRDQAVAALLSCLEEDAGAKQELSDFLELDQDSTARVISGLAKVKSPQIVSTVARIAALPAADNVRNIAPLWKIFWTAASATPAPVDSLSLIANRLLRLCGTGDGLHELQNQQRPDASAEIVSLADRVYPFSHGLRRDSNLPLLLAAMRSMDIQAKGVNTLVDAIQSDDANLSTLERDYRRRAKYMFLFWPARAAVLATYLLSIFVIANNFLRAGWQTLYFQPGALWLNAVYLVPIALSIFAAFVTAEISAARLARRTSRGLLRLPYPRAGGEGVLVNGEMVIPHSSWNEHGAGYVEAANGIPGWADTLLDGLTHLGAPFWDSDGLKLALAMTVPLAPIAIAIRQVVGSDLRIYLPVATVLLFCTFWLPAMYLCARRVRLYLRRRNPLMLAYTDPKCRHWICSANSE